MATSTYDFDEDQADQIRKLKDEVISLKASLIRSEDAHRLTRVRYALQEEAKKQGVLPTAVEDAVNRALRMGEWQVDAKGGITLKEASGLNAINGRGDTMTPALAIKEQKETADHLYVKPAGASNGSSAGTKNPFVKGSPDWNLTEQGRLERENPDLARQLAAEAGVTLPPAPKKWGW
ncbi:hypothetical protein IGS68_35185 (plasmid) [Skermanella sp. TT6]|uniref:Uncharacterized protein n=1 Tax=Skermanella cutis TaxID=2775420 RepID=A0ABX7BI77_9PROT|nr:hypothetical protein [Skermanella sp. TT6]QQP94057.1 hypothetical protein IGS68_35185 [Skermanella sp. TT6]